MQPTNIDIDRIERALPVGFLKVRNQLIEEAIKTANIWLTTDPKVIEYIDVVAYRGIEGQRAIIEEMFDDNMSVVLIQKRKQTTTPETFWSAQKIVSSATETSNYLFTRLKISLKKEIELIKETLDGLRNPRVSLTIEEHRNLLQRLKRYDIDLTDYYI